MKKINQGPHNKQNIVFTLIISASLHRVKMAHVQNGLALKWLMSGGGQGGAGSQFPAFFNPNSQFPAF